VSALTKVRSIAAGGYEFSVAVQQTGYRVYRFHKVAFGNLPGKPVPVTFQQFLPDLQQLDQDVVVLQGDWETKLENNKKAYADQFVQCAEFIAHYQNTLTPEQFVDALNANTAGALTESERAGLVAKLTAGTNTRAEVLRTVAENAEVSRREFNSAFVLMQYFGYLRRNPDSFPDTNFDGYNFWLTKLNSFNGDFRRAEMVKAFISSDEYRHRFGP
jgi:hypothetical protein